MTDRRPGPPLFELLRENQPDPEHGHGEGLTHGESEGSVTSREHEPAPEPSKISAGVSRAERSAATMPDEPTPSEGGVHLSMSRVYLLIAFGALALVLVWAGAYKYGFAAGKQDMESFIPNKPMVLPPIESMNLGETTSTDPVVDDGVGEPPRVPAKPAQAVMTAQGYKDLDPRVSGHNYLQLATLSTEQAADAVIYMTENGMPIIGVPVVDSGVRAGNNPSRYTLYSIGLAVPGGSEFRAMQSQRTEHVRAIARLGAQWQRERRGGSDFGESKTQWVKYN